MLYGCGWSDDTSALPHFSTCWLAGSSSRCGSGLYEVSLRELGSGDAIDNAFAAARVASWRDENTTDFLDCAPRAHVLRSNTENHILYESECVLQHQPFHFPIEQPSPTRASQERPTDLDLAVPGVVTVETRGPDDLSGFGVEGDQ